MATAPATMSAPLAVRLPTGLNLLLLFATTIVLLTFAMVTLTHLRDTYQLDHVSGIWMALAHYLNRGTLYPGIYENAHYGGSRYGPLYFTVHASLARLTGEYVLSGKLLSLSASLACGALVFWTLRCRNCAWQICWTLTALALVSSSGYFAATTIRGDLLPVVWLLAALLVAHQSRTPAAAILAALFCTLAVLTKVTAGWAPLAIIAMTFRRDRKFLVIFLVVWLGSLAAAILTLHFLSAGRLLASFCVYSDPGFLGLLLKSPVRLLRCVASTCPVLLILMPFALLECGRAVTQRRLTLYHWSFFFCIPILVVIFADRGTIDNHLVDLVVLVAILVGLLWSALDEAAAGLPYLKSLLVLALLWALGAVETRTLGAPIRDVFSGQSQPLRPNKPLADVIGDDAVILTENGLVDVSRGQAPVVLDPYALVYIEKKHPDWVADLAGRVKHKEFAFVVLEYRLDLDPNVNDNWYAITFGRTVSTAIRENYHFLMERDDYCVLVPN